MPAHSECFPWPSYYGHFKFFEARMKEHRCVVSLTSKTDGVYELIRTDGDVLRVFICECYAFGVAEYIEVIEKLGALDAVIINSAWCGYSPDVKLRCRKERVGLFKINEFMAALHQGDYWMYLTDSEKEYFKKHGQL